VESTTSLKPTVVHRKRKLHEISSEVNRSHAMPQLEEDIMRPSSKRQSAQTILNDIGSSKADESKQYVSIDESYQRNNIKRMPIKIFNGLNIEELAASPMLIEKFREQLMSQADTLTSEQMMRQSTQADFPQDSALSYQELFYQFYQ
jgi:hypothetical protein